jgi:hypothetical protein
MIDKPGLAGLAGCHCQLPVLAEHVDEGRLSDVGPADEGKFREFLLGLFGNPGAAAGK